MVTVLLVASVLTVVSATATFVTVQELRSSNDDRAAGQALSFGEGGVDRMVVAIKRGDYTWNQLIHSGCPGHPTINLPGNLTGGSFNVRVLAKVCPGADPPLPFTAQEVRILSQGVGGQANREIEQVVNIVSGGLPIGVFAFNFVNVSGSGTGVFENISLVTPGDVNSRDKLETIGCDVWLTQDAFYKNGLKTRFDTGSGPACNPAIHMPAAVHAGGSIFCDANNTCNSVGKQEHVPPGTLAGTNVNRDNLNCTANGKLKNNGSTTANSAWDGSSNGGPTSGFACPSSSEYVPFGQAPTSLFTADDARALQPKPDLTEEDYANLKSAAQSTGIYCDLNGNNVRCYKKGVLMCGSCGTLGSNDLPYGTGPTQLPNNYIIYADFPVSSALPADLPELKINATLGPCNLDETQNKSAVIVSRYGNVDISGGQVSGAILADRGAVKIAGNALVHGSIIAQELEMKGSSNFKMDKCSLQNLVSPFITVNQVSWREVDR